jgi:hypothetical protein
LDSKPLGSEQVNDCCKTHEVAGLANSSKKPNAKFVDVGFDTILEALVDLDSGIEVLPKYGVFDKNGFRPC